MATPMMAGIITSAILELLLFPVIYIVWRKRELPDQIEEEAPLIPPALIPAKLKAFCSLFLIANFPKK